MKKLKPEYNGNFFLSKEYIQIWEEHHEIVYIEGIFY